MKGYTRCWMCAAGVLLAVLFTAPRAPGATEKEVVLPGARALNPGVEMEGLLYFDRGHYWLEIRLAGMEGGPPLDK